MVCFAQPRSVISGRLTPESNLTALVFVPGSLSCHSTGLEQGSSRLERRQKSVCCSPSLHTCKCQQIPEGYDRGVFAMHDWKSAEDGRGYFVDRGRRALIVHRRHLGLNVLPSHSESQNTDPVPEWTAVRRRATYEVVEAADRGVCRSIGSRVNRTAWLHWPVPKGPAIVPSGDSSNAPLVSGLFFLLFFSSFLFFSGDAIESWGNNPFLSC